MVISNVKTVFFSHKFFKLCKLLSTAVLTTVLFIVIFNAVHRTV